jgi:hypothetical protein
MRRRVAVHFGGSACGRSFLSESSLLGDYGLHVSFSGKHTVPCGIVSPSSVLGPSAMENPSLGRTSRRGPTGKSNRVTGLCVLLLSLVALFPAANTAQIQPQARQAHSEPTPAPAIPEIVDAFDTYEVVAMPQGHGIKDLDDFILALIRTPAFLAKVNDIVVECGNSLYQPVLDRYTAGEDVPFAEVQKVWRNTTQLPAACQECLNSFSRWCVPSIRNCLPESVFEYWRVTLLSIGRRSRGFRTS